MPARILIIEDNPTNLELMLYLLKAYGHTAISAVDGQCGVTVAQQESPDLIICDIQLPRMNGYEVLMTLRKDTKTRRIPVVAVTAYAMLGDRDKLLACGFDGYISKPIDPETFVEEAERFIRKDQHSSGALQQHEMDQPAPALNVSKTATVLVVDDSPVNLDLIQSTLGPSGYRLILASNPIDAMSILQNTLPDLILSDLHMPYATGYEFLKAVKEDPNLNKIPFVIITSSSFGEKDRELCLNLGAKKFLLRPIEPQSLLAEVKACIA